MEGIKNYNTIVRLKAKRKEHLVSSLDENGNSVKRNLNINNDEDIPYIKNALKNYVKIEGKTC